MNFIFDALEENPEKKIIVFTTRNTTSYITPHFPNTKIYRFGTISANPIKRYASYLWFNLMSSVVLFVGRVDKVTVFETLSIFPFWLVSKICKSKNGHIHFHEYTSEPERRASSVYVKFLFKLEDQLLKIYSCSQTNEDRKQLFLTDKLFLKTNMVEVRPNMPPNSWWNEYGQYKKRSVEKRIKLVYVGACNNQTMYVKEVLDWVEAFQDQLELTIISQELDAQTRGLIARYVTPSIKVIDPIDYYDLPKVLVNYDFGLVLYKGVIDNHKFSIPNKVYEYLACGLGVLTSNDLTSTIKLFDNKILALDLSNLNQDVIKEFLV